ncbi:hypothetical protein M1397_02190 [Candidatus Marsarchaeota archaeon]|jgi:hypothetical protein|nr:hypothetical protein [Candidatus Marsarchaeota archaeon]
MQNNYIVYFFMGIGIVAAGASMATLNVYLIGFTALIAVALFVSYKLWDIIEAWIFKHSNIVQVFDGFQLSGSRTSAIAIRSGEYTAVSAVKINSVGAMGVNKDNIEKMISRIGYPFKLVLYVKNFNTNKLLERLQTRKKFKEIELSRIGNRKTGRGMIRSNAIKEEIAYLDNEISQIGGGGIPLELSYYLIVAGHSESKYKAEELSSASLRGVTSEFDATFGSRSSQVTGNELLELMKFDSLMI